MQPLVQQHAHATVVAAEAATYVQALQQHVGNKCVHRATNNTTQHTHYNKQQPQPFAATTGALFLKSLHTAWGWMLPPQQVAAAAAVAPFAQSTVSPIRQMCQESSTTQHFENPLAMTVCQRIHMQHLRTPTALSKHTPQIQCTTPLQASTSTKYTQVV
jgi:hypothetical protein